MLAPPCKGEMALPERRLRVCAYARVSTDREEQAGSYESQVHYFTEYIRQHEDWELAGIYADEGVSGTSTKKREGFAGMMSDARSGKIDLILTKEVSRFARNTVDTLSHVRELRRMGVYVLFLNDGISTADSDGELRLSIMATIAQDESRKTSERVKWGQKRRMEAGTVFGRDLLGYSVKNGRLYLNEEEAETVRLIFGSFLHGGRSACAIARELTAAGIAPKRAQKWSGTAVLRVLRNEKYVGDLCQKKTFTPDYLDHVKRCNRGQEELIYLRDHHPETAIIDRDTWNAVQKELSRRAGSGEKKERYSSLHWCSGRLLCGECGGRPRCKSKKLKNGETYRAWRCPCGAGAGDKTLRYLTAYALGFVKFDAQAVRRSLLASLEACLAEDEDKDGRERIKRAIESLKAKKLRLIDLAAGGEISADDLKTQNAHYDAQLQTLAGRLSALAPEGETNSTKLPESEIDRLLGIDPEAEKLLGEVLRRLVIYKDGRAEVFLRGLPAGVRLRYRTHGRAESFRVEAETAEFIEEYG